MKPEQFVQCILEDEEDDGDMPRPPKEGLWNGRPAYIGVADVLDGHITFARSYETAKQHGWHHSMFLRPQDVDGLENNKLVLWFIDERGRITLDWDYSHGHSSDTASSRGSELKREISAQLGLN
jgi:hypothetical protein